MKFGLRLNDYISNHVDSKLFTYDEINIISEFIKSYCMDLMLSRMYGDEFEGLKDNQPMREYEMDVIIDVLSERFDRFINGNEEITWKIFRFYYPKDSPRLDRRNKCQREIRRLFLSFHFRYISGSSSLHS